MRIDVVKEQVLRRIKPTKDEEEKVKRFANHILRIAKTVTGLDCVLVGSLGKFTWLRGDHDIDLFMMFPADVAREELEKQGLELGKKIVSEMKGKWQIKYAEHPYVHAIISGFDVDIVPCYRIAKGDGIKSAVDRSPLHLEYVLNNIRENQQDEIRLLKQFAKGVGVYGSDAKHLGFSGYICELLVLKYGSFENVLASAQNWHIPHIVYFTQAKERFHHPLIIVDPTDEKRNAAANLSGENLLRFIAAASGFMKKPDEKYFFKEELKPLKATEIKLLQKRGTVFIALVMQKPELIEDVLYPQLRKSLKRIETVLRQNDFIVFRSGEFAHKKDVFLFFELVDSLPKIKKMTGPPIFTHKHSEEFLTKYKTAEFGPYIEDNRWVIEKKRVFTGAESFLKDLLKQPAAVGIPKNMEKSMKKSRIISRDFWGFVKRNKGFSAFLRGEYFSRLRIDFSAASGRPHQIVSDY